MGRTSRALQMTVKTKAASAAFLLLIASSVLAAQPAEKTSSCPALWQKTFPRLQDDKPQDLCQYRGKVALVVNTASYCGFTSQYEGLEKVYARYQAQGLVVLGFPSNDFGQQEPGNSKQIADFCFNTYGVKFPMFAKTNVTGNAANPLFKELIQQSGSSPRWNFHKYLVDRQGKVVGAFRSETTPEDALLIAAIQKALKAP
ncbi:glutathione peroxidase [Rhodoferax mekongensis]|uniref:glutathione peroxidase n=1 Tax=Rhodoferax mekongensis TaxID=3068341 RepID=UPI0028BEB81B|nr:glutathione peroxidase [Rhodoferax sp. TBRC 17199]MDT7513930.1 glutathione peroxidase [Rhodoferax sp. TBRC 17199]